MNLRYLFSAFFLVCGGFLLSTTSSLAQDNFLPNPGFEDWAQSSGVSDRAFRLDHREAPAYWLASMSQNPPSAPDEMKPLLIRDVEIKHGGEASARIEIPDPTILGSMAIRPEANSGWAPGPVPIEPGKKYIVRGWLRGEDVVANDKGDVVQMHVLVGGGDDFFGGANNNRHLINKIEWQDGTEWFPFEFEFETADSEVAVFFSIGFCCSGKFWIDDLEIVQAP